MRVHNEFEAKALLKEMAERGENIAGVEWVTHDGEYIFTSNGDGTTVVVPLDIRDPAQAGIEQFRAESGKPPIGPVEEAIMAKLERFKVFVTDAIADGMHDEISNPDAFLDMALETFLQLDSDE